MQLVWELELQVGMRVRHGVVGCDYWQLVAANRLINKFMREHADKVLARGQPGSLSHTKKAAVNASTYPHPVSPLVEVRQLRSSPGPRAPKQPFVGNVGQGSSPGEQYPKEGIEVCGAGMNVYTVCDWRYLVESGESLLVEEDMISFVNTLSGSKTL